MRIVLLLTGAMLILYTVLTSFVCNLTLGLVMPALIGLPPLLIGIFWKLCLSFFAHGAGKWVKYALIGGYAVFFVSFAVVAGQIVGRIADDPEPGADCVIVLGAAVRGDVPSATFRARLDCAYEYLADNPGTRVIVTGGQGQGENITEAEAARRYLEGRGIEPERILMEDKSTSTQENLAFSKEILAREFEKEPTLILVSSDYHLYRAQLVAKNMGLDVQTMGNPSIPYLIPNFYLREYVAVLAYRLLGRMR